MFGLFLVALLAWSQTCHGVGPFSTDLAELAPIPQARLEGVRGSVTLKLPVPDRWEADSAVVHLKYVHSTSLLPHRSQIVVLLDGVPLAQAQLDSPLGMGELVVEIPGELLDPGYHDLVIEVAQRSTEECQDPKSPELWTVILLEASTLSLDHSLVPLPPSLGQTAEMLFDDKQPLGLDLLLVLEEPDATRLEAAAIAVSSMSVRLGYRPLHVTLAEEVDRSRDCLLMGTREYVAERLHCSLDELPAGNLGLYAEEQPTSTNATNPMGGERALLVLTGASGEELLLSARGLALFDPLPEMADIQITEVVALEVDRYASKGMLRPGSEYSFEDLGFSTRSFQGIAPVPAELSFRLPSDLLYRDNQELTLELDLSFGSGMQDSSVLNVAVNGVFAAAVGLGGQQGGRYRSFVMPLPATLFQPGSNTVSFHPVMAPLSGGACEFIQTENLVMTLSGDSVLRVPEGDHWTAMPHMGLFFQDGFPHAALPDWSETTVVTGDGDLESLAAALNIVAMICQANGLAPLGIQFAERVPEQGDVLYVGVRDSLPQDMVKDSLLVDGELLVPEQGRVRWQEGSSSEPQADRFQLAEFRSPQTGTSTWLVATAKKSSTLLQGVNVLWDPGIRSQCSGGMTVFAPSNPEDTLRVFEGDEYYLGSVNGVGVVDRYFQANPWLGTGILLCGGLILAWGLYRLLLKRKPSRSGHAG